jgi:hypothetical protein
MEKLEPTLGRSIAIVLLVAGLVPLAGCRICADCEDLAYPAYGGAWQRTKRNHGRVGSIFDPAGAKTSELVSRDTPPDPHELEQQRQEERGSNITDPDRRGEEGDTEPKEERDMENKSDQLRERQLDDIQEKKEDELRTKELDDIKVRLIPGEPLPPVLR